MAKEKAQRPRVSRRFGIGEVFGRAIIALGADEIRRLSSVPNRTAMCPFKGTLCAKKGGVCSLILLERDEQGRVVSVGSPVTTCPNRFLQDGIVFQWVGETLIETGTPEVVSEVPFLMAAVGEEETKQDEVGRIDSVLVNGDTKQMSWCALEMQAVYFSGMKMEDDLSLMRKWRDKGIPFPQKIRRPDFRSSGPKRLMPQLQIKVPTLRRWGKKMAVVVDKAFWESLGEMRSVKNISNADIVWFVVDYQEPAKGLYRLKRHATVFTTLENAVEGLTGGTPVSLEDFEESIRKKLRRS